MIRHGDTAIVSKPKQEKPCDGDPHFCPNGGTDCSGCTPAPAGGLEALATQMRLALNAQRQAGWTGARDIYAHDAVAEAFRPNTDQQDADAALATAWGTFYDIAGQLGALLDQLGDADADEPLSRLATFEKLQAILTGAEL